MTESELIKNVAAMQQGDRNAFTALYYEYYQPLYFYILKLTKDKPTAEDMTQETFVTSMEKIGDLRNPAAYKTWLFSIASNNVKRQFREQNRFSDYDTDEELEAAFEQAEDYSQELLVPSDYLENKEVKQRVKEAIDSLPDMQRSSIILFYYENMRIKEIARVLGINENAVNHRLAEGRRAIAKKLEDVRSDRYVFIPLPLMLTGIGKELGLISSAVAVGTVGAGTAAASSAATGSVAASSAATGSIAASSAATGSIAASSAASGTVAASSAASGSVAASSAASGSVAASSVVSSSAAGSVATGTAAATGTSAAGTAATAAATAGKVTLGMKIAAAAAAVVVAGSTAAGVAMMNNGDAEDDSSVVASVDDSEKRLFFRELYNTFATDGQLYYKTPDEVFKTICDKLDNAPSTINIEPSYKAFKDCNDGSGQVYCSIYYFTEKDIQFEGSEVYFEPFVRIDYRANYEGLTANQLNSIENYDEFISIRPTDHQIYNISFFHEHTIGAAPDFAFWGDEDEHERITAPPATGSWAGEDVTDNDLEHTQGLLDYGKDHYDIKYRSDQAADTQDSAVGEMPAEMPSDERLCPVKFDLTESCPEWIDPENILYKAPDNDEDTLVEGPTESSVTEFELTITCYGKMQYQEPQTRAYWDAPPLD